MSTTPIEAKPRVINPRIGRRNEILAILLLAIGLLLTLCLVSAAFYPTILHGTQLDKPKRITGLARLARTSLRQFFSSSAWLVTCCRCFCLQLPGVVSAHSIFKVR